MNPNLEVPIWTIQHVAAALHLEVDTAREYTYRPDFPAPAAPFSMNLWLREEVLTWFAELPKRDRKAAGTRNTTKPGRPTAAGVAAANADPAPIVRAYTPRKKAGR
jgi:hypothetical protein